MNKQMGQLAGEVAAIKQLTEVLISLSVHVKL